MDFFPYAPRPHQRDLVRFLQRALERGEHAVVESGTGTGKTVTALTAALTVARDAGKRVLYLTRTHAQERQVMMEFRAIRSHTGFPAHAVALQGRKHLCPLTGDDDQFAQASPEELGVMCRDRMRALDKELNGEKPKLPPCMYDRETRQGPHTEKVLLWARENAPTAEELAARCVQHGLCPYNVTRALVPDAAVVVAPYVYYFHPHLRTAFLQWMNALDDDLLVIVDEAHNLPDLARELASASLTRHSLQLALKEADDHGNPTLPTGQSLKRFLQTLERVLDDLALELLPAGDPDEDALVPPGQFDATLLEHLGCATPALDKALRILDEYGEAVRDHRRKRGRVPRSYVGSVGAFLQFYRQASEDTHVRLVEDRKDPRLECYALDPSLVTGVLRDAHGSLHLSGTLQPLEEYRDSVGLPPGSETRVFPSPFADENRLVLVDPSVTTRYDDLRQDPDMWDRIGRRLAAVRKATDRNLAVFLPSHEALRRVQPHLAGARTFAETQGAPQADLMRLVEGFKNAREATLVSVMGGRLSEGFDFPDDTLEVVAVVGLPYGRPTARQQALVRFYDRRFGKGWAYAVDAPMQRKVLQAVGRLIRTPTDRGVVLLLDHRAHQLRRVLRLQETEDPAADVRAFFDGTLPAGNPGGDGFSTGLDWQA